MSTTRLNFPHTASGNVRVCAPERAKYKIKQKTVHTHQLAVLSGALNRFYVKSMHANENILSISSPVHKHTGRKHAAAAATVSVAATVDDAPDTLFIFDLRGEAAAAAEQPSRPARRPRRLNVCTFTLCFGLLRNQNAAHSAGGWGGDFGAPPAFAAAHTER